MMTSKKHSRFWYGFGWFLATIFLLLLIVQISKVTQAEQRTVEAKAETTRMVGIIAQLQQHIAKTPRHKHDWVYFECAECSEYVYHRQCSWCGLMEPLDSTQWEARTTAPQHGPFKDGTFPWYEKDWW
jgi:hypothetical protein